MRLASFFSTKQKFGCALAVACVMLYALADARAAERLPNTGPLQLPAELVKAQFDQIVRYWQRRIKEAAAHRDGAWRPDFASAEDYVNSLASRRDECRQMLGLIAGAPREGDADLEKIAEFAGHVAFRVTTLLRSGVSARGLLFMPARAGRRPAVIVCPDAESWPEKVTGLEDGELRPWLLELLARGAAVYVPQSVERLADHAYCRHLKGKDRRTILYRLGYVVGCIAPGLDVQDVLTAVDYLVERADIDAKRLAIIGRGQGGMTALFAMALEPRLTAAAVVDYFDSRDACWQEPVDRRLPGQLLHCADAELAALAAPRRLAILYSPRSDAATDPRQREFARAMRFYAGLHRNSELSLEALLDQDEWPFRAATDVGVVDASVETGNADPPAGSSHRSVEPIAGKGWRDRHFEERLDYLRRLIDASAEVRKDRWRLLARPAAEFGEIQAAMRGEYKRLAGAAPAEPLPLNPRTELIEANDDFKAYHVLLSVTPEVEAYGQLLVPNSAKTRTAAVICQHGLSGTPAMITGVGHPKDTPYHQFGGRLAKRGYVVFAPMVLHYHPVEMTNQQARMADAVGAMRISLVAAKTERVVDFLQSLPMVDAKRIGYYGLSYGGYSAIWAAPLVERLAAVVISGHFNDWREKITSDRLGTSYLFHPDEDFYNWKLLPRFAHPELLALNFPKPLCIEVGRRDGITTPEWTMAAWNEVVALRDHLQLTADRVVLTEFDGPHEVHGVETFEFLDRWIGAAVNSQRGARSGE